MAAGKISIQANDGKVAGIMFEDGASSNVTVTVPKEGGVVATKAYADTKASKTGNETIAGVKTFSDSVVMNGNVGIGTSSPVSSLTIKDGLTLISQFSNSTPRPTVTNGVQKYGVHAGTAPEDDGFLRLSAGGGANASTKSYIDISGYSNISDMNMNIVFGTLGSERMRIGTSGNVMIGTSTDNGVDKLQVNGNVLSKRRNNSPVGETVDLRYITSNASTQLGDGRLGNLSAAIVEIQSASGLHSFPIYGFGGNGVAYTYNYMNPGTAAWVHSVGINMSFTEVGVSPNTYLFTVSSGNGIVTIQATTYNSPYTVTITTI